MNSNPNEIGMVTYSIVHKDEITKVTVPRNTNVKIIKGCLAFVIPRGIVIKNFPIPTNKEVKRIGLNFTFIPIKNRRPTTGE